MDIEHHIMISTILISVAVLGGIGLLGSLVLWGVSKRFHVYEDPRIAQIEKLLPGANCGGCGRSGCHDFATACAQATSLDGLNCPGAGAAVMQQIAEITGLAAAECAEPQIAVVKCTGSANQKRFAATYTGPLSCAIANASATAGCPFGCLGCGDCVEACRWDAIEIDPETGLPVVNEERCTGCGKCVGACPRHVIELRPKGRRGLRVWVACNNRERGAVAKKACDTACIGCGKCAKTCGFEAITVKDNLAWIDPDKCKLCRKCVDACPTGAILTANFPVKKNPQPTAE